MDVTLGDGAKLSAHGLRAAVLGEVHARPFTPMETPRLSASRKNTEPCSR